MNETDSCFNCKYFRRHYMRLRTSLIPTFCGTCIKAYPVPKKSKKFPHCKCEWWEDACENKEAEEDYIKRHLKDISKQLSDILAIMELKKRNDI